MSQLVPIQESDLSISFISLLIAYEFLDLYISYLSALDYNKIHSNGILLNNNYETLITLLSMTVFNICETCNPFR